MLTIDLIQIFMIIPKINVHFSPYHLYSLITTKIIKILIKKLILKYFENKALQINLKYNQSKMNALSMNSITVQKKNIIKINFIDGPVAINGVVGWGGRYLK